MKKKIKKILLIKSVSDYIFKVNPHLRDIRVDFTLKYLQRILFEQERYDVKLIDCMSKQYNSNEILRQNKNFDPDIVVFSISTIDHLYAIELANKIKQDRTIFVAIGQDPTYRPEKYLYKDSPFDFVLKGECEIIFSSFTKSIEGEENPDNIEGVNSKNKIDDKFAVVSDLNSLPDPLFSDEEIKRYKIFYPLPINRMVTWGHVLSSRGCPYDCIFCSQTIRESYGKKVRFFDPVRVVNQIEYLKKLGVNVIYFDDDNFTTAKEHVLGVCKEIKKRKLKIFWTAHARVDNCDFSLLQEMASSGCVLLRFGIESGSEKILKTLKKTPNVNEWKSKTYDTFENLRRLGIASNAMFLIGNPGETENDINESINLVRKIKPDILQICFFTPYPGSRAFNINVDKIDNADVSNLYHYDFPLYNFSKIDNYTLKKLYVKFYKKIIFKPYFIFNHIKKFAVFYLFNPNVFLKLIALKKNILGKKNACNC